MAETSIEWTDKVWNPMTGCTRISSGCRNCYAFELHGKRHEAFKRGAKLPQQYAKPFTELQMFEDRLQDPLRWKKPCRVFVNSMSDLFHEDVPDSFIDRVFATMRLCPHHTFQVLTKRAERMAWYVTDGIRNGRGEHTDMFISREAIRIAEERGMSNEFIDSVIGVDSGWPKNVWAGVSVENQYQAEKRIPDLLQVPAAVRFLSVEPMLGPIDLDHVHLQGRWLENLHWIIVGGESGADARPCNLDWVRLVKQQCQEAGVPFFFKQAGSFPATCNILARTLRFKDKKGGDPNEWPVSLRVREFPHYFKGFGGEQ